MRFLKVLTIAMGVLIVVATTVLVVLIARRLGGAGSTAPSSAACCWTSRQARGLRRSPRRGIGWRCSCRAAGPDRVVLIDPRSGAVVGRIGLRAP